MGRNQSHKPVPHKSKLKKDPGIPRLPDLKIRNAEKQRTHAPPPHLKDPDATMASEPTLSSLALLAAASSADPSSQFDDPSAAGPQQKTKEQLRRFYIRALHKVIDESDVVVLVLDARDPEGCRSRLVEEEVRRREAEGKKLVFVLNKIDLVPRQNALNWLRYLRHTTPTLPFRSSTSHQRSNLSSSTAPALMRILKAYKPSAAQSVTVGVVGYPNVGKSSLINTLKRSKVCAVASQPGHTKDLQHVQLERGLRIVDSPGVIFDDDVDDGKGNSKGSVLLRNVIRVEDVQDPVEVVEAVLARTEREKIQKIYGLPEFGSALEFLTMLALSTGKLLKGGTPDILAAARQVLTDWNHQKIPFFSVPPAVHPSQIPSMISSASGPGQIAPGAETVGQAQILTALGQAFTLEGLFGEADQQALPDSMEVEDEAQAMDGIDAAQGDRMDEEEASQPSRNGDSRKRARSPVDEHAAAPGTDSVRAPKRLRRAASAQAGAPVPGLVGTTRRAARLDKKKNRKDARRAVRSSAGGGGAAMELDDVGGLGLGGTFMAE